MKTEVRVSHVPHEGCTSSLLLYRESASVKKILFYGFQGPFLPFYPKVLPIL